MLSQLTSLFLQPGAAMAFLAGKRALIIGLATERSIAYGIAEAMKREGAELAFSYQERFKDRVEGMGKEFNAAAVFEMDVGSDESIAKGFEVLKKSWDHFDIVVHAVAFAPSDAIRGGFVESTTRENFRIAHDISSYSLTAIVKAAEPMMAGRAGSVLTLTYLGAVRSLPSYNVMGLAKASLEASVRFLAADLGPKGIRVNGISAGPIKTLAAAGIGGFRKMLSHVASIAPLRRNVTAEDVGNTAAFLAPTWRRHHRAKSSMSTAASAPSAWRCPKLGDRGQRCGMQHPRMNSLIRG